MNPALIRAETLLKVSIDGLLAPLPNTDHLKGSAAADPFAVTLTQPIIDLQKAIADGQATVDMIEAVRPEIDRLASARFNKLLVATQVYQDLKTAEVVQQQIQQFLSMQQQTQVQLQYQQPQQQQQQAMQQPPFSAFAPLQSTAPGGSTMLPQCIGVEAGSISFEFVGAATTKQEEQLSKVSTKASPDVVSKVREFIVSDNEAEALDTLTELWQMIATLLGVSAAALGAIPMTLAIESLDLPVALNAPVRLQAGGAGEIQSKSVPLSTLVACRTDAECRDHFTQQLTEIKSGNVPGMVGGYEASSDTRVLQVQSTLKLKVMQRQTAQNLIGGAIIEVLSDDELLKNLAHPSEFKTLLSSLVEGVKKPTYEGELCGPPPSHAASLLSSILPGVNLSSRAIAQILYIKRDRHRVNDLSNLGYFLQQLTLKANEAPGDAFGRIVEERKSISEPNPLINYPALGIGITPGTKGEGATFAATSNDAIACVISLGLGVRLEQSSFADARAIFDEDYFESARNGTLTAEVFHANISRCNSLNIVLTPPASQSKQSTSSAFGAFSGAVKNTTSAKGGVWGKGSSGGGGKGSGGGGGVIGGSGGGGGGGGGGTGTSKGSGGKGGKGGKGGDRGRTTTRDGNSNSSTRSRSVPKKGDEPEGSSYARAIELMGTNFQNFQTVAGLVNVYYSTFDPIKKPMYKTDAKGALTFPVRVNEGFSLKGAPGSLNYDSRKDIYELESLIRDIQAYTPPEHPNGCLTRIGFEYAKTHPQWIPLNPAAFKKAYHPASRGIVPEPRKIVIQGKTVKEFTS